jgi:hypothetical protein
MYLKAPEKDPDLGYNKFGKCNVKNTRVFVIVEFAWKKHTDTIYVHNPSQPDAYKLYCFS